MTVVKRNSSMTHGWTIEPVTETALLLNLWHRGTEVTMGEKHCL